MDNHPSRKNSAQNFHISYNRTCDALRYIANKALYARAQLITIVIL